MKCYLRTPTKPPNSSNPHFDRYVANEPIMGAILLVGGLILRTYQIRALVFRRRRNIALVNSFKCVLAPKRNPFTIFSPPTGIGHSIEESSAHRGVARP